MSHSATKIIAAISLSFWVTACTESIPEFNRLQPLRGVVFNGKSNMEVVIETLGTPINITADCDRTATDIVISEDKGSSWESCNKVLGSAFVMNCKQLGQMNLTLTTDNLGLLQFTAGVTKTYELKFKAKDGNDTSTDSILKISYRPSHLAASPNNLIYSSGGQLLGTSHVLQYRMGTSVSSQTTGLSYKIESSQ